LEPPVTGRFPFRAAVPADAAAGRPHDVFDLYGVLAEAGSDLARAAEAVYVAGQRSAPPPAAAVLGARGAAVRVLRTLAAHDDRAPSDGASAAATYMTVAPPPGRSISDNPRAAAPVARGRR
jgi:hypothetical protein